MAGQGGPALNPAEIPSLQKFMRRRMMKLARIILSALLALHVLPLYAQSAARPIRLVVPYPPGGIADMLAREVATPLAAVLGQAVVIENKGGGAGALGSSLVKNAEPDGLTLLFTNVGPSAIAPAMSKAPPYDAVADFRAVTLVSRAPLMLVARSDAGFNDIRQLIAAAKAKPAAIEYSSAGVGSFGHLSTELFAQAAGIRLLHVPYQGQAPATLALLTGEVKIALTSPSAQLFDMVRSGKLRLLGVSTTKPTELVPGAQPIADVIPGFDSQYWFGIVAPAKVSDAAVARIDGAMRKVLADPAIAAKFRTIGNEIGSGTPALFQKLIADEASRWKEVVKAANIQSAD